MKYQSRQISMIKAMLVATLALTSMVGCANNSSNGDVRVRTSGTAPITTANTGVGTVVYDTKYGNNFQGAVNSFVSEGFPAGMQVGTVDPSRGITISGQVHFDTSVPSQNLISSTSGVSIIITDSLASQMGGPIVVNINGGNLSMGSYTQSTGVARIVFEDQYGWVYLNGQVGGGSGGYVYTGQIFFGTGQYSYGTTGTYLGDFNIPMCSFFACQ